MSFFLYMFLILFLVGTRFEMSVNQLTGVSKITFFRLFLCFRTKLHQKHINLQKRLKMVKMYFNQLLGRCSSWNHVEIHNTPHYEKTKLKFHLIWHAEVGMRQNLIPIHWKKFLGDIPSLISVTHHRITNVNLKQGPDQGQDQAWLRPVSRTAQACQVLLKVI